MMRFPRCLALFLLLCATPGLAWAANCNFVNYTNWSQVVFNLPASITVPQGAPAGTVLWTSPMIGQNAQSDVQCTRATSGGIYNYNNHGQQPASGSTLFPTYVPGLALRLARGSAGNYLVANPGERYDAGTIYQFQYPTALELVLTGPIAAGAQLNAGELLQWWVGDLQVAVSFQAASTVTFTAPACRIAIDPTVVVLPVVTTSAFGGTGSTAGETPFAIELDCSRAANVHVTLDANNARDANNGVLGIATGNGSARGVGVQILHAGQPVRLRQAIDTRLTPSQPTIPFSARYYRTGGRGNSLHAGSVSATATYTLTYD